MFGIPAVKHRKARYLVAVLIITLTGLVLVPGCNSEASAKRTVARFMKALIDGNDRSAERCCTERFANAELNLFKDAMGQLPVEHRMISQDDASTTDIIETLACSIDGDTAKVWVRQAAFTKFILIKEKGMWKIDRFELDLWAIPEYADFADI